jgi:hypothetical protein
MWRGSRSAQIAGWKRCFDCLSFKESESEWRSYVTKEGDAIVRLSVVLGRGLFDGEASMCSYFWG